MRISKALNLFVPDPRRIAARKLRWVLSAFILAKPRNLLRFLRLKYSIRERYAEILLTTRLEKSLEKQLGGRFRYQRHEQIGRNAISTRRYEKYEFSCNGVRAIGFEASQSRTSTLFVKHGRHIARPGLERFLNEHTNPFFYTPRFFGCINIAGNHVGAWEYVAGRSPQFHPREIEEMRRIVRALASINAIPVDDLKQVQDLPVVTPWVEPVAARMAALVRRRLRDDSAAAATMLRQVDLFARMEDKLVARFDSLGNRFLTHNDVKPENVIIRPGDAPPVIIDWTSARISAPGVSLRFLARWDEESRTAIAADYVEIMGKLGHALALDDVLFAIEAHHAFKSFSAGLASEDLTRINHGLKQMRRCRKTFA